MPFRFQERSRGGLLFANICAQKLGIAALLEGWAFLMGSWVEDGVLSRQSTRGVVLTFHGLTVALTSLLVQPLVFS